MAENEIAEMGQSALRNNFVFYSIIALLLSQITSWTTKVIQLFRRIDRKEEVVNKLALDLVKIGKDENTQRFGGIGYPVLTMFFVYKEALKKKIRHFKEYEEWIASKEKRLEEEIEKHERTILKLGEEQTEVYEIKESRKIPDSLKEETKKIIEDLIRDVKSGKINDIYSADIAIRNIHSLYACKHREETRKEKQEG